MCLFEKIVAVLLTLISITLPASAENSSHAMLAWIEPAKNGYNLNFSVRAERIWSKPETILNSSVPIITPAVSSDDDSVWVVFVETNGSIGRIRVIKKTDEEWQRQPEIVANTQNVWGPSIIIDNKGTPWLAWAGYDGIDDDIYYTFWNGNAWKTPEKVNTDDDWPDTLPILALNNQGAPEVRWSGFNGSKYIRYFSTWDGNRWSQEAEAINPFSAPLALQTELPSFLTDKTHAALHIRNPSGIQSTRLGGGFLN